jgi:hypothetical protein
MGEGIDHANKLYNRYGCTPNILREQSVRWEHYRYDNRLLITRLLCFDILVQEC